MQALVGNRRPELCFEKLTDADGANAVLDENVAEDDLYGCAGMCDANGSFRWLPDFPETPSDADDDANYEWSRT
jgi:hypothetical protein